MSEKCGGFVKVPVKILQLGLDVYELAAFVALASHGGENGTGIFPSWSRLRVLTGMSRDRLWKSLDSLSRCNVIQWDRGRTGVASTYTILGTGAWSKKRVDKSGGSCGQVGGVVRHTDTPSPPHGLPGVRHTDPNQIQLNQNQLTTGTPGFKFVDNWDQDRVQAEKKRQIAALAAQSLRKL